jgi:hypothetical protein
MALSVMAYAVEGGLSGSQNDPTTYRQATTSPQADAWRKAMQEEIDSLGRTGTWTLVRRPPSSNVIDCKWVYKTKKNEKGEVIRYKARLVAKGYTQIYGLDYVETYSPVTRLTSIRIFLAVAAARDWEVENLDIDTAYLNAQIKEDIYLQQPTGFQVDSPDGEQLVYKLHKALYGLKQAGHNWNVMLDGWLKTHGLQPTSSDPCTYVNRDKTLIILIWVDDIIIGSDSKVKIRTFKEQLGKTFKIKDLGQLRWILGMEVRRDRGRRTLTISQQAYIEHMLDTYGMSECKPVGTPTEGKLRRTDSGQPDKAYMKIVGSILYAAVVSRPDVAYAAQNLGRHMQSSNQDHMTAAKRVLRYLKGTKSMGLTFSGGIRGQLKGYSDSDWGGDLDTSRSTTGYLFMFGGGPVSWNSRLQPTVALSTSEAEYMALCATVMEATYLKQLLFDIGIDQSKPITIYEDNQSCIAMARNPINHSRTKHINIRFHYVREQVKKETIKLEYLPTEGQVADMLTKGLPKTRLMIIRGLIMGQTNQPEEENSKKM